MIRIFVFVIFLYSFLSLTTFASAAKSKKAGASPVAASGQFLKKPHVVRAFFANLKGVNKVSYVLMYEGNGIGQGVEGSFVPGKKKSLSKDLFLGTCSRKVCIRHKNIKNIQLEVTTRGTNGKSSTRVIKVK